MVPGSALAGGIGGIIDNAATTPGAASASPLALNGLLVLNKSSTLAGGGQVTVLKVAGLNLLSKSGENVNTGALAAAGTLLDTLNHALCGKGALAPGFCLALLFSNTSDTSTSNNASAAAAAVTLGSLHLRLLGSETSTVDVSGQCKSTSLSYVASVSGVVAVPANVLGGLQNGGAAAGPC
jgi:hypothetical protein